jgi:hypothetical protein
LAYGFKLSRRYIDPLLTQQLKKETGVFSRKSAKHMMLALKHGGHINKITLPEGDVLYFQMSSYEDFMLWREQLLPFVIQ